jgi:hypothetical protein
MSRPFSQTLTPENALIFRITHRENVPWILRNGLHCPSADVRDQNFISIGNPELIERRRNRPVDVPPGGTLEDYIAFYFTPYSPMLYNIRTGYGGIRQRRNEEIAVLVSSLSALKSSDVSYVFTDRHAYLQTANFFDDDDDLPNAVDFALLQSKDFARDAEYPEKFDRYQAEALAHRFVPVEAILRVGCYTSSVKDELEAACSDLGVDMKIVHRTEWYFS